MAAKAVAGKFGHHDDTAVVTDDITPMGNAASSAVPTAAPAPAAAPTAQARTYTVVSGDTLSKIAKHYYGDANDWPKIFDANRDKLSNPDKINIGQVLQIP